MRRWSAGVLACLLGPLGLCGCAAAVGVNPCATLVGAPQCAAPAGLMQCTELQGRFTSNFFRAVPLGTAGPPATFRDAELSVVVSGDSFQSTFLGPGEPVLERQGRLFIRGERVELGDEPLFPRTAPGLQSFRCGRDEDGTVYLRTDALGFDFDANGAFEPALLEVNLVPTPP